MARAIDVVRRVAPRARQAYLDAFEQGDALLQAHGVDTPLRLAHFLAQVLHESGGLTVTFENMSYSAPRIAQVFGVGHHSAAVTPNEAARLAGNPAALAERVYGLGNPKMAHELGNTAPGDGFKYRGGGILQTTGRANYRHAGQKCGADLEGSPDLVCTAAYALKPALTEWTEGDCNALADRSDIRAITRKINGGYNGLASRQDWFTKIRPLIDKVDLKPGAGPVPPPPDVAPLPAKPKPAARAAGPAAAATAAAGTAAVAVAHHAHMPTYLIAALLASAVAAVAAYLVWSKK